MQTYAVTIQATAERTFILGATSIEEAEARAKDFFDFNDCMNDLSIVEATQLERENKMENAQLIQVEGYWQDDPETRYWVNVFIGSWDGYEDEKDRDIFYYTNGQPLKIGDVISDGFVVTNHEAMEEASK